TQRGKFNTNEFRGIEGNQGPYQLTGRNGERRLVIVAGSERVFLNGEQMTRGEVHDYTIDYSSGEVVFTSKRLTTNASRITIDFEYTDRQFTRNLLAGGVETSLARDRVRFNARFVQEADDPDAPLDGSLDDEARARLSQSGADRFQASLPGARIVGRDSTTGFGLGQYVLKDTAVNGNPVSIFVYTPGDSDAIYTVVFSIVDQMPQDSAGYARVGIGHFRFAGIGQGNYLPIQFLPMPQLQRLIDFNASADLGADLQVTGEYAASHIDLNRFSALDNNNQQGSAVKFGVSFKPRKVEILGVPIGDVDASLSERYVDRRFVSLDRFNEVEFSRNWNLESPANGNEEIREASLAVRPSSGTILSAKYGLLELQDSYRSTRLLSDLSARDSAGNGVQYQREDINSENLIVSEGSQWTRQKGTVEYAVWAFRPGFRIESEERTLSSFGIDSLRSGSFQFIEIAPRLATRDIGDFSASAEFQFRLEDSARVGAKERAFTSLTQLYAAEFRSTPSFSTQLGLSIRNTKFTEPFRLRGNPDSDVLLVRSQSRYSPFDRAMDATVFYEFANQRAARYERVFLRVPRGTGNYRYKGDLNNNGIPEEDEFELTRFDGDYVVIFAPGDQLIPVLDLKANFRLRLEPARLLRQADGVIASVLNVVTTETLFRVEERSSESDTKQIYLLNLNKFLNSQTTLAGTQYFTQDLHLFEYRADFSTRFRYSQRKSLIQLVSATERSYSVERSVRVRSQLLPEIGNQTEFTYRTDKVSATAQTPRVRDLIGTALSSDFSYRPEPAWELGFRFEVARVEDRYRAPVPVVDVNEQSVRTSYAFLGKGQLRAEVKREEVVLAQGIQDPTRPFPYEFTNGKVIGKSLLWQIAFDYRFSQHIQMVLQYNGRKEGDHTTVHLGQVEAKVFF
ncbi:MAG: hypothetical protein L0Y80_01515, partial [Ignavibacteriae bacterium]|nr:hypothetical protein [Ignavibacteriota bacterium]